MIQCQAVNTLITKRLLLSCVPSVGLKLIRSHLGDFVPSSTDAVELRTFSG
jgi:hypothetical protein